MQCENKIKKVALKATRKTFKKFKKSVDKIFEIK